MRYILYITLLLLCTPSFLSAQQYEDILNNRKVHLYQDGYKTVFTVGTSDKSPKRDKSYYWYGTQQVRTTRGGYSGKVLHGPYTRYYADNNLAEAGTFRNGLKHGTWQHWYADGTLQRESVWQQGEETGAFRIWDVEGHLLEQGRLHNGLRDGKMLAWDKEHHTFAVQYFDRGKEITKEMYTQRNLFSRTGSYINGLWQKLFSSKEKTASD